MTISAAGRNLQYRMAVGPNTYREPVRAGECPQRCNAECNRLGINVIVGSAETSRNPSIKVAAKGTKEVTPFTNSIRALLEDCHGPTQASRTLEGSVGEEL